YGGDFKEHTQWLDKNTDAKELVANRRAIRIRFLNFYTTRNIRLYNLHRSVKAMRPFYFLSYGDYIYPKRDWRSKCQTINEITRPLGAVQLTISKIQICP